MAPVPQVPTPPPDDKTAATADAVAGFSRVSPAQAAADAIPLLIGDTYNVFHLTTPPWTRHHPPRLRSTWWRLRSKDLAAWTRDAAPCIVPDGAATGPAAPDADGAWTGAAVVGPDGALNVFYTGYNLSQGGRQVILRTRATRAAAATADAPAVQFALPGTEIRFSGAGRSQLEDVDFRDPFVFYHGAEGRYWMVVASRLAQGPHWTRGCIALLTSPDLDTWTFAPQPLYSPNDLFCPECPELWYLASSRKWYLVYSRFHAPDAGTVYRVADSPYGPFRIPRDGSHGRLDGRRWYAAKSCAAAGEAEAARPSQRVFFGWIGDHVEDEGKWLWGGDLAVPRVVVADPAALADGWLRVDPAPAAVALAEATSTPVPASSVPRRLALASTALGATTVVPLDLTGTPAAASMDVLVSLAFDVDAAASDAFLFGLVFQPDADQRGYRLQFAPSSRGGGAPTYTVTLFADLPPLDDFWADQYNLHLPRPVDGPEIVRHEGIALAAKDSVRIFLRRQLVEVFCGGRSISFRLPRPLSTTEATPATPATSPRDGGRRLSWFVSDGTVVLDNIALRYGGQLDRIVQ